MASVCDPFVWAVGVVTGCGNRACSLDRALNDMISGQCVLKAY